MNTTTAPAPRPVSTTLGQLCSAFRDTRPAQWGVVNLTDVAGSLVQLRVDYLEPDSDGLVIIDGYLGNVPVRMSMPADTTVTGIRTGARRA